MRKKGREVGPSWMARLSFPRLFPKRVIRVVGLEVEFSRRALLGRLSMATILQPVDSIGMVFRIFKILVLLLPFVFFLSPDCLSKEMIPRFSIRWH